jgi:hypothetical protein
MMGANDGKWPYAPRTVHVTVHAIPRPADPRAG